MNIPMKLAYQYMTIFLNFLPTSNHIHSLQIENCDSNSRLVVDEDDSVKSGLKGLTLFFNPLTAGAAYIRVFVFISTFSTTF